MNSLGAQGALIPPSILENLPGVVRESLSRMPIRSQEQFLEEYHRKSKKLNVAYVLWFFFAFHYVYLGRWGFTLLMWGTFLILIGFVWWLVDAFRLPGMVRDYNKDVATDVMRMMKALEG